MKNESVKKYIVIYLSFAFGLPFICVLLVKSFNIFQSGVLGFTLYGIEAMTPAIAALLTTAILGDSKMIRLFLKKCYFDNIKIWYIILAVIIPFSVFTLAKITSLVFVQVTPFITSINGKKLLIIMWALITEELGWRGFLQERLDMYFGHLGTPIIIGIIWALWHYHFFWLGTMSAPFILFVLGCITDSIGYYWITKKSKGNVIPASVWHCVENLCFSLFLINPEYNQGRIEPYLLYTIFSIVMAVIISILGSFSIRKDNAISY